MQGKPRTEKIS